MHDLIVAESMAASALTTAEIDLAMAYAASSRRRTPRG
jgi:hypothetical protein